MSKARVLYIEDYPVIQQIYIEVLREHGYDVDVASDGKEAVEKIKATRYDFLLVDLLLPRLTGIEFLEIYKKGEHLQDANTKVIILTDFDGPETVEHVKQLGFQDYLIKVNNTPYTLVKKIDASLSGKPISQEPTSAT